MIDKHTNGVNIQANASQYNTSSIKASAFDS